MSITPRLLVSPDPAQFSASRTAWYASAVLVLTSLHHVYGARIYGTPWRYHVLALSLPALGVIFWSRRRLWREPADPVARWVFALTSLVIPILAIGVFEGLYNHVAKDLLYFAGAPLSLMTRLFPPPTYEMPNDAVFEVTGIAQVVPAALAAWYLYWSVNRAAH